MEVKLTYGDVFANKVALQRADSAELDGKRALQLQDELDKLLAIINKIDAARNRYIKSHAPDGKRIDQKSSEWFGFQMHMAEVFGEQVTMDMNPVLKIKDFEKISPADIRALIQLGLMHDPKAKEERPPEED